MLVRNTDAKPQDYEEVRRAYRPSHADYTYQRKYGIRAWIGGGRASARETVGRVAAGAIAQKLLRERCGTEVLSYVARVQSIEAEVDHARLDRAAIEATPTRCPDPQAAERMVERIGAARKDGDSLGGVVQTVVRGVPPGLGEPVFDKLEADLGKALLSLPACKGFEIGSGFGGTFLTGSTHNDPFYAEDGRIRTRTNHSGGVQGRHHQWRGHHRPRRLQADRHHPARAGDGGRGRQSHHHQRPRPPRSVRAAARRAAGGRHGGAGARRPLSPSGGVPPLGGVHLRPCYNSQRRPKRE